VLTLPDATDTLVGLAATQVLTNKTLSGNTAVTLISGSGTLVLPTSGTFTLPNVTDTAAGLAASQALTNKTINGSSNTLTNVSLTTAVTGILPAANGGTGVANNAASTLTISGSFGTTFTVTGITGVTLPTTGTLTTLAGTETFTNKTLTSPKLNENVAVTTTATKLNYLTSAGGTTGTASTNLVFSTSPTLVTPTLGAATATSLAFSPTTGGIVGTATNDAADAGKVGEYVVGEQTTNATLTSAGSNVYKDVASVALTAGDWDISARVYLTGGASVTAADAFIGTVANNDTTGRLTYANQVVLPSSAVVSDGITGEIARYRVSISGSATYYLKIRATYGTTPNYQGRISARRVR
jgi:hypothetical protein